MNNSRSLRRADNRSARPQNILLISLLLLSSLLLSACVGENSKDEKQSGKIERSVDVSGRWSLSYVTSANTCGVPQNNSQVLVDVVQQGAEVSFVTVKGAPLLHGSIDEGKFTSSTSAAVQADGREFHYSVATQLIVENNTMVGEEEFSFGDDEGEVRCTGKTHLSAVRSINRSSRASAHEQADTEPNDTLIGSVAVPVNVGVTGLIDAASDRVDIYALPIGKLGTYQIGVTGFGYGDLDIALVDRFHNLLATSENAMGLEEGVTFSVDAANNAMLYVIVSGFDTGETATDYTLQVTAP